MIGTAVNMIPKFIKFSGGEVHTTLDTYNHLADTQLICRIQSSDDLVALLMVNEIIDRRSGGRYHKKLVIPYLPYARQDRVTELLTAFSLKVLARLINDLKFDEVVTCDVHSDVAPALIERLQVVPQLELIKKHDKLNQDIKDELVDVIIAPDAGAYKKAAAVAAHYKLPLIVCNKKRDVASGEITGTHVPDEVNDQNCLIVDDICDGGRTFTELANAAKLKNTRSVSLYVTHGIFSKGLAVFDGLIDNIYTTSSFRASFFDRDTAKARLYIQELDLGAL